MDTISLLFRCSRRSRIFSFGVKPTRFVRFIDSPCLSSLLGSHDTVSVSASLGGVVQISFALRFPFEDPFSLRSSAKSNCLLLTDHIPSLV